MQASYGKARPDQEVIGLPRHGMAWHGMARLELTKLAEQGQALIEDKGICKEGRGWRAELSAA